MKVGIIGFGYVGQAIAWAHHNCDELVIRDPKLNDSAGLDKFVDCDAIFVCVPSPSTEDGHCDTSILEQTLKELLFVNIANSIPIICKTTAPPSVYKKLLKQYPNIVHCPEFLTAANNTIDYMNSMYFVLGGHTEWIWRAKDVIQRGVKLTDGNFIGVDIAAAALYKYMMNCYLATKVTLMNDFKALADAEDVNWESIKQLSSHDLRFGTTHMDVPGPDGHYGWGGGCFPKDVAAIIMEAIDKNLNFELMQRVETINKKHRGLA
jgi:UDPglucose 6-dehydrogenase